jgi:transposase-like protein
MSQPFLPGFPDGATKIGDRVNILSKGRLVFYFLDSDLLFTHRSDDEASRRCYLASLVEYGHVRAVELERSELNIPHRTLMNWCRQLRDHGVDSFYASPRRRGGAVMTEEVRSRCDRLLATGKTVSQVSRIVGINDSTLRKAVRDGRVVPANADQFSEASGDSDSTSKSERSVADAQAAAGMGTACTRADERVDAAIGLADQACARFEHCHDVQFGGLLSGLPALSANGLYSGLGKHLSLEGGYYSAMHIVTILAFMALARIRRPEGLRHIPPGEFGKTLGLDRVTEVKTLRRKIGELASSGSPREWQRDLARQWMEDDPDEAGYLYLDGHVRVYHGSCAKLPKRYVSRDRLCLEGTTDYWVNDAIGRPFFAVTQPLTDGLATTLLEEIVPELLEIVPGQPTESELAEDPLRHRFVIIFDREGATHSLISQLWEKRIAVITYRKAVKDRWPEEEFHETKVPIPGGGETRMMLKKDQTQLTATSKSLPVLEVRRLTETGHQTAIITTARRLESPVIAGRMFSRWCQENFFAYMMQHYDIDGLIEYGVEELPGTKEVINPAWRILDKEIRRMREKLKRLQAKIGAKALKNEGRDIEFRAEQVENIQQLEGEHEKLRQLRKETPKKVTINQLPEGERPQQLPPLKKTLTDTIKMIAYRAETALVGILRSHLAKEEEARAMIRELFISSADFEPDEKKKTLTVSIHRMTTPAHDKAISALLEELNQLQFRHPETDMQIIYKLV